MLKIVDYSQNGIIKPFSAVYNSVGSWQTYRFFTQFPQWKGVLMDYPQFIHIFILLIIVENIRNMMILYSVYAFFTAVEKYFFHNYVVDFL